MSSENIDTYYNRGREQDRLSRENGKLELVRTKEIISRYLPKTPINILDIGGGAGIYALWLASLGHEVHLVDIMPIHIEQAQKASSETSQALASISLGDARQLDFANASADIVLFLGPLYHLPEHQDRIQALREAYRVLKPNGWVFAATISRFASFLDGINRGFLADDYFAELVEQALIDGRHNNPKQLQGYFTTAYFHHPNEIQAELIEAGFEAESMIAIEGAASFMPDFDKFWEDEKLRERLLQFIRSIESDSSILGASGHLMTIGKKS